MRRLVRGDSYEELEREPNVDQEEWEKCKMKARQDWVKALPQNVIMTVLLAFALWLCS